jgi:hypothetical protein
LRGIDIGRVLRIQQYQHLGIDFSEALLLTRDAASRRGYGMVAFSVGVIDWPISECAASTTSHREG